MLQVWNDKTCVNDKIYDLTIVKKPYAIDLHVKFINGVDGVDQYLGSQENNVLFNTFLCAGH